MGLIQCPACDNQVSTQAESCPHCGHPLKTKPTTTTTTPSEPQSQGLGFWGVVGAVVVAIIILSFI